MDKVVCPKCGQERSPMPFCKKCRAALPFTMTLDAESRLKVHDKAPEFFHKAIHEFAEKHGLEDYNWCSLCAAPLMEN